jgi:hypothetical protein
VANLFRGEVPFKAAGRDLFVCYGTPELAEIQTALGFRRPDPFQPDRVEEVDEPILERAKVGEKWVERQKLDEQQLPAFRRTRVLVDHAERQRRMLAAFEAVWMQPDPEAALVIFRISLKAWERRVVTKLLDSEFAQIVRALGVTRINLLHMQAIAHGVYLKGEEEEDGEGKATGAVSVSTT